MEGSRRKGLNHLPGKERLKKWNNKEKKENKNGSRGGNEDQRTRKINKEKKEKSVFEG